MRWLVRVLAVSIVLGAVLVAYAVGNGDIRATPEVTVITITSTTGTGTGTATLENTTTATTYNVLVGSDAGCDPALMFAVAGGNPVAISPSTTRSLQLSCPARGAAAMRRCTYHATNNANGTALADFMTVCLYGNSPGTLTPQQTSLDFGTVSIGDGAMQQLLLRHDGSAAPITHVYLQTSDLAGNFQFSTPCNPDAPYCDEDVAPIAQGGNLAVQVRCTPQTPGVHTAQLYIGTNTFQLLAEPVTLRCTGAANPAPVLTVNPTSVELATPIEATSGSANVTVHLTNAGGGTLVINDVRIVDVDAGAALDWTYTASGECSGVISSACSVDTGELVDINLTFDPSAIGRRRATLLVSYKDTIDRTKEIPLDATGLGATLAVVDALPSLAFGSVPVGRSSTIDFKLANSGNRDITAQLSVAGGTTPPFSVSPGSAVVTPTADKAISVTCAPMSTGMFTTTISAQAMDALVGSTLTLGATCEGSSLALYASPSALDVGELRRGGGKVTRTVQLLSTTGAPLTLVGQPQLASPNPFVTFSPLSQQTTPASFDVTIDPAQLPEGQLTLAITVGDDDGEMLQIPLVGKIVTASYEVSPAVDLGTFCVGQPTSSSNLSLLSDGTATIRILQPVLDKSPSLFQLANVSPALYPNSLAAGATATVAVRPLRQNAVTQLDDTLIWRTDVDNAQNAPTTITARFIDQGAAIAPPVLDFGKVTVHLYGEDGQRVVIQNCNPTPLVLDPPMIKTPFSIDSPNFPAMLNPNESTTFSVGFHPARIGVVTDTLRITSPQLPGMPLEVMLIGEGTAPMSTPPDAGSGSGNTDTSFYACSCRSTSPGGVLPILLALGCVLLPRRAVRLRRRPRIGYPGT
jgi:hypothetical protein